MQALLRKHWTLEHLLGGIGESEVLVNLLDFKETLMGIPNFPGEKCVGRLEGGEEGGGVCQTIAICGGGEKDWRIYRGATICGTKG